MALAVATLAGGTLEAIAAGIGVKRAGYPMIPRWAGVTAALAPGGRINTHRWWRSRW